MSIGQAYTNVLSSQEQKALQMACDLLIDHAFEDPEHVEKPEDVADSWLGIYLPERYLLKYTPLFLKKFTVCLIIVTWKLAQTKSMRLSSLAEELAAWTIVREAQRLLEDELEGTTKKDTLDAFIDDYFEDLDVEHLFDNASDGIDQAEVGQYLGMTSLAFDDWFKPFSDEPDRTAHPYVLED